MSIQSRVRAWLGITRLLEDTDYTKQAVVALNRKVKALESEIGDLETKVETIQHFSPALGRIIAKLDPAYNRDLSDPAVRAESDRIGAAVMARLRGEHIESNKYGA